MIFAFILELIVLIIAVWLITFLSTLLHELGHALAYMLSTGGRRWHIRVGSGKRLLETKALTVKPMVFDGEFEPAEDRIDSKAKLIATLAGGPAVSLVLVVVLLILRYGGISFSSDIFAAGAISSVISYALYCNVFILVLSLIPGHYFFGEIKGMETDGMKILSAAKDKGQP